MKKKILGILLGLSVIILGTGCTGNSASTTNESDVNIAYFPNVTHAQAMVMKSQGTLENKLGEDYNVKWTSFNAGPDEVDALKAGEIDIGFIGPVPAISANVVTNDDVVIISGASSGGQVLITSKNSKISSVKDLKGKTVAIPQLGNTQHLSLLKLLADNDLKTVSEGGKVNVVAVSNSDVENLFMQGEIDAALVPEPWATVIENNKEAKVKVLLDYDKILNDGDYPVAVVVVRKEFMKENPEVVNDFLQANIDATDYINDNIKESAKIVNDIIEEVTGSRKDDDVMKNAFSRIIFSTDISNDALSQFAQISYDQGFIAQMPTDALTDFSVLDTLK